MSLIVIKKNRECMGLNMSGIFVFEMKSLFHNYLYYSLIFI